MLKEEHNEAASTIAPHLNAIEKLSLNHDSDSNNTTSMSMSSSTPTAAAETVFFAPTIAAAPVEVIGTLSVSSVTHSGGGSIGNTDSEASGTV